MPLLALLLAAAPAPTPPGHVMDEDAAWCRAGKGPALQVNVSDLKDRDGEVWLEVYPANEADFLADDTALIKAGKTFRRVRTHPAASGDTPICVHLPAAGRYAVLLRHSRTGKDKFSFWSDGVGFARNEAIGRARPKVGQATMDAGAGVTTVSVRMQYLHGLRGFAPG